MKITDGAKVVFQNEMKNQKVDFLKFFLQEVEGEQHLRLDVVNNEANERFVEINGINVILDEELETQLESIVFDSDGENLIMKQEGGCGCGGHDDGEGCGCGSDSEGCGCGSESNSQGCGCH